MKFHDAANGRTSPVTPSYYDDKYNHTTKGDDHHLMADDDMIDLVVPQVKGTPKKTITHGVPLSITIPAIPVTPDTIRTTIDCHEMLNDEDGCSSSVEMEPLGGNRYKRHRDDASSTMKHSSNKRKRMERHDDMSCCSIEPPQELIWDGSLSYLDGMADHASLMSSKDDDDDDCSIGTFDISHCAHSAIGAFPDDDDEAATAVLDNDDDSSDDGDGDFVVVAAGTSIAAKRKRVPVGRTRFTCRLARCTRKNV